MLKQFTHIVVSDSARHLPTRNVSLLGIKQVLAVSTLSQKMNALENAMGISHLPEYLASQAIAAGKLTNLKTSTNTVPIPLFMYWRKGNTGKANQWLRQHIIARNVLQDITH